VILLFYQKNFFLKGRKKIKEGNVKQNKKIKNGRGFSSAIFN